MGIRKCLIKECPSSSARKEDRGVTFHRIPAKEDVKRMWIEACRLPENYKINKSNNVCSRHFKKADFQDFKGTKYVLKNGAVPTIFSWSVVSTPKREIKEEEPNKKEEVKIESTEEVDEKDKPVEVKIEQESLESIEVKNDPEEKKDDEKPNDSKEEKAEALEIKHEVADDDVVLKEDALVSPLIAPKKKTPASKKKATPKRASSARAIANSAKKARRSDPALSSPTGKDSKKAPVSPRKSMPSVTGGAQSQINFTPGTKIEAQDFAGKWHPATLLEVDTEEREVLVQFDKNGGKNKSNLNDEWIPMDSVRLRPLQQPKTPNEKIKYSIGEKCFARWSDSRKFRATIQAILENDMYEVLFDDGFVKVCKVSHISKSKKLEVAPELDDTLGTPIKQEEEAGVVEPTPAPVTPIAGLHIPQVAKVSDYPEIPKTGEWCCHWMNDFPIGEEATVEVGGVKIHSVIVADWRLPEGWVKHVYQRITAFGKVDVLLANADGKVFRSRLELKAFLAEKGETYDTNVYDFGLHKKRAKDLGFCHYTQEYKDAYLPLPVPAEPVLLNTEINIGSVKVKIIDNLLQCPEEDCLKTFRKENHLQIHIKHYHKELAKGLGEIPNMQDLASLRTPVEIIDTPPKMSRRKSVTASTSKTSLKEEFKREELDIKAEPGLEVDEKGEGKSEESSETVLKKEKLDSGDKAPDSTNATDPSLDKVNTNVPVDGATLGAFDAEEAIESLAVTKTASKGPTKIKMFSSKKKKYTKKSKIAGSIVKAASAAKKKKKKRKLNISRAAMDYMEADDTRHSFATVGNDSFFRHGYNFDKDTENSQMTNASICGQYGDDSINAAVSSPRFINENGEVIKIVSMKKEEIINCLCGYGEEDGLMVQCELCLCWQHGICNGFERDTQVPDKYVCYICRNPQGGRESRKYIHDQDWLYEGKLPVANYHVPGSKNASRFDILKQSHTLGGNLLELKRFMHSLKVKINIAEKKDHPKMYLWSKKWESSPPRGGNGDLSGIVPLNSSFTSAGTPQTIMKTEQKQANMPHIPVPEAPIDPAECQAILLEHIQKQQNAAMARLQAIEAQIIALEAYDDRSELLESPTAKNYPKTKQTIHMLLNDLDKMKKISAIHRSAQQPPTY
ncbi:uncharacterized protein LOC134227114 [Armigeres subalbatus]|uniref:uncharacterized protein LOC134227114 n=1 Tax=Armigeres subalbatus TaxID=124917 RepID=UPI002ED0DE9A